MFAYLRHKNMLTYLLTYLLAHTLPHTYKVLHTDCNNVQSGAEKIAQSLMHHHFATGRTDGQNPSAIASNAHSNADAL